MILGRHNGKPVNRPVICTGKTLEDGTPAHCGSTKAHKTHSN